MPCPPHDMDASVWTMVSGFFMRWLNLEELSRFRDFHEVVQPSRYQVL